MQSTAALSTILITKHANLAFVIAAQPVWAEPPIAAVIGAEVGFSSAGAGALGSLALMSLTPLTAAQVVGTDVVFGLVLVSVGILK